MQRVRRIASRIWSALRTPWGAAILLVVLTLDGIRVVEWHNPDRPSTLVAAFAESCGRGLGVRPAGYMCILTGPRRPVPFALMPDGSLKIADERARAAGAEIELILESSSSTQLGVWTEWLGRRSIDFTFEPSASNATRRRFVQAYWQLVDKEYYADMVGQPRITADSIRFTEIHLARLANEIVALLALGLLARAGWYSAIHWRSDRRRARGACPSCGYSREGLDAAAPCPECGAPASLAAGTSRNGSLTSTTGADAGSGRRDEGESP